LPTFNAGVIIAEPVRDSSSGKLVGIIAINPLLGELSEPLTTVVQAQQDQGHRLMVSTIGDRGELIATPDPRRILQTVLDELPGAGQSLQGQAASLLCPGADGQDWLFSAVPVPDADWAVVV